MIDVIVATNKADMAVKPGEADKAKADKANEAANEADAKANKDYESKSCQGRLAKNEEAKSHD